MRKVWAVCLLAVAISPALAQSTDALPPEIGAPERGPRNPLPTVSLRTPDPVFERVLKNWPDGKIANLKHPTDWGYEEGVVLDGVVAEWRGTGDGRAYAYAKAAVDRNVEVDGVLRVNGQAYPTTAHALENLEMGRSVVTMYRTTHEKRYYLAAKYLHDQVHAQPRNPSGGYWHREADPDQMWLEGAFLSEPFMANFARTFGHEQDMEDVAGQLLLMDAKMRDRRTGLLREGWDESRKSAWADKKGLSPEIWARGMGWYAMALVDVLDRMPDSDPQRAAVEDLTRRIMLTVVRYQDPDTGLWWQVMDKGTRAAFTTRRGDDSTVETPASTAVKGNFPEASASCMFVYALLKGVRMGVLPRSGLASAERGWQGIQATFVKADGTLTGSAQAAGLGGTPAHNGSFDDYTSQPLVDDDPSAVGAYLLAHSELIQQVRAGKLFVRGLGKTVLFDSWFNSQRRRTPDGAEELYRFKYNEDDALGYSFFSRMFQQYGMRNEALTHAPRADDLKNVAVYVIVSPDSAATNTGAHTMDKASADAIEAWVRAGGILLLMHNDKEHAEFEHFNMLSERFGLHFNAVTRNQAQGDDLRGAIVPIAAGAGDIFHVDHKVLEKEVCTLTATAPAMGVVTDHGDVLMAVTHSGKGLVFGNANPWLYNEFTDGRNTPLGEDNFAAGQELVRWLVTQIPAKPRDE